MLKASDFFETFNTILDEEIEREFASNGPVKERVKFLLERVKGRVAMELLRRTNEHSGETH